MPVERPPAITRLLEAAGSGDADALSALLPLLYDELHALAHRQRLRQRGPETLNTTALLHEAYVKLARADGAYADRAHFFRVARAGHAAGPGGLRAPPAGHQARG
jgi:hypothetical protein